jgi:hypothetical protein
VALCHYEWPYLAELSIEMNRLIIIAAFALSVIVAACGHVSEMQKHYTVTHSEYIEPTELPLECSWNC